MTTFCVLNPLKPSVLLASGRSTPLILSHSFFLTPQPVAFLRPAFFASPFHWKRQWTTRWHAFRRGFHCNIGSSFYSLRRLPLLAVLRPSFCYWVANLLNLRKSCQVASTCPSHCFFFNCFSTHDLWKIQVSFFCSFLTSSTHCLPDVMWLHFTTYSANLVLRNRAKS